MLRPFLVAMLSLSLLNIQLEGSIHALTHLGVLLARAHESGIVVPHAKDICGDCARLASGTTAAYRTLSTLEVSVPVGNRVATNYASCTIEAPSYFSSRAPPVLL